MRSKVQWSLVACAVVALVALPVLAGEKTESSMAASVTGEVIDSSCYIKMGAKGEGHAECAKACGEAGVPLAILEEGTDNVYFVLAKEDATSANDALLPYVAEMVTINGTWAERGGAKVIVMESVEPAA